MRVSCVGIGDGASCHGTRVCDLRCPELPCGHCGSSERHFTVGQCRTVFHQQNPFSCNGPGGINADDGVTFDDFRRMAPLIAAMKQGVADGLNLFRRGGVGLVYQRDIRQTHIDFTRMIAGFVTGTQRVQHGYLHVGAEKCRVVVTAVPDKNIGLGRCRLHDAFIVHTGRRL